jgi:hypothetical protein
MMTDQLRSALALRRAASATRRLTLLAPLALVAAAALACGDGSSAVGPMKPGEVVPGDTSTALGFIREESGAPLISSTASFYAVKGQDRRVRLYYVPNYGSADTVDFMTFRVDKESLDRRPDGSVIADGDSVLITVTLTDPDNLIVQFAPSGLRFSATKPARLHYYLGYTDPDRNRDGVVNATDDTLSKQLIFWRQESAGQPWVAQASFLNLAEQQIETDVFGFTGYAVAYRSAE